MADDNTCFRFAILDDTGRNGLGHRWLDVALILEFAAEVNATAVLESNHWTADGLHGNYDWFPIFAGIHELTANSMANTFIDGLSSVTDYEWDINIPTNYSYLCNVIIHTCDHCCSLTKGGKYSWCIQKHFPNAVTRLGQYARPKFEATPWGRVHRYASSTGKDCLSVLVHIRDGDILYGCGEKGHVSGAQIVIDLFTKVITAQCAVITFVAEENLSSECKQDVERVKATVAINDEMHVQEQIGGHPINSLWNMVTSDILIGSGSSFPIVAATLSQWLVHIAPPPKSGYYNYSTLHDEVRYIPPLGFARPDPIISRESIYPSNIEIGNYICNKVITRRGNSNLCKPKQ